jgi:cyclase
MADVRLIARLDIKGPNLIKGIHLEGLRVVGDPQVYAINYYEQGADELLYMDIVASLYGRNTLTEIVSKAAKNVFVPMTVGGGVRTVNDAKELLRAGADKVVINTAAVKCPELIRDMARRFGSQCVVLSIEAKQLAPGRWEAYTDNGRERTGIDVVTWAIRAAELGAGEILVTSVDQEGTRKGFDVALMRAVSSVVSVPVIASGGMGAVEHMLNVISDAHVDAIAVADMLHYGRVRVENLKSALTGAGIQTSRH